MRKVTAHLVASQAVVAHLVVAVISRSWWFLSMWPLLSRSQRMHTVSTAHLVGLLRVLTHYWAPIQVKPHALPPAFGWSSQDGEYRLGM